MKNRMIAVLIIVAPLLAPGRALGVASTVSGFAPANSVNMAQAHRVNRGGPVCAPTDPCGWPHLLSRE